MGRRMWGPGKQMATWDTTLFLHCPWKILLIWELFLPRSRFSCWSWCPLGSSTRCLCTRAEHEDHIHRLQRLISCLHFLFKLLWAEAAEPRALQGVEETPSVHTRPWFSLTERSMGRAWQCQRQGSDALVAVLLRDCVGAEPRQKSRGSLLYLHRDLVQRFHRGKEVGPRLEHCSSWTSLHGKIYYIFNTKILLSTPRYHQTPQKKAVYKQYAGVRVSWHDPVPMGIFVCSLAFSSTLHLDLNSCYEFNPAPSCMHPAGHLWGPQWLGSRFCESHMTTHPEVCPVIVAGYKPDCHQEKELSEEKNLILLKQG